MSVNLVEAFTVSCETPGCGFEIGPFRHRDDAIAAARGDGWYIHPVFKCRYCCNLEARDKLDAEFLERRPQALDEG